MLQIKRSRNAFYLTRSFITVFTKACHPVLPWDSRT